MDPDLPSDLKSALDTLAHGRSRRDMAPRLAAMSRLYRSGGGSAEAITNAQDALAYAFARMPATYAAVVAALGGFIELRPDFAPRTLIDVGAGPGTAAWAAARYFSGLDHIRLIEENMYLRALALGLLAASVTPALRDAACEHGDFMRLLRSGAAADLVVASYVIGELAPERLRDVADALWSKTRDVLVVIEPGTTEAFGRIRGLRTHLIAHGAYAVAPCPHDGVCPIVDPDWCHFSQRLPRSRDHRQVKGASLPFEDEKFSYVVLGRWPLRRIEARVLAHPRVTKGAAAAKLCTPAGITHEAAERRDRDRYKEIKGWRWGDAVARPLNVLRHR